MKSDLNPMIAEEIDRYERHEAFKGQPEVIGDKLPMGQKALEQRLDELFEYLARNSADPLASSFARARIEQVGQAIERLAARRVSLREWLGFIIAAGGLAAAILAIVLK